MNDALQYLAFLHKRLNHTGKVYRAASEREPSSVRATQRSHSVLSLFTLDAAGMQRCVRQLVRSVTRRRIQQAAWRLCPASPPPAFPLGAARPPRPFPHGASRYDRAALQRPLGGDVHHGIWIDRAEAPGDNGAMAAAVRATVRPLARRQNEQPRARTVKLFLKMALVRHLVCVTRPMTSARYERRACAGELA